MLADCPLCVAERRTRWYYSDSIIWIADCDQCRVPMVVFVRHTPEPSPEEMAWAMAAATALAPNARPDFARRTHPDHAHFHLR